MISSWIDNRPTSYSSRNNPYEFQLILRGNKDVFAPIIFWDICHGHSNTIVITKIKGTDEIIGGRVKNEKDALFYYIQKYKYGPCFVHDEFLMESCVSDFTQDTLNWCDNNINNCYENLLEQLMIDFLL
ncbi:hypothetical protein Glove_230g53 [Diversispora epigaea]|uniref:TLDc domain-containing protein n=1 Tax=Diversispora epigaea TaxID=1348612 RepID=A0A397IK22_9GLOM|nr:hypothetical protein Glove_230g53 [Diversispora epigaea]